MIPSKKLLRERRDKGWTHLIWHSEIGNMNSCGDAAEAYRYLKYIALKVNAEELKKYSIVDIEKELKI